MAVFRVAARTILHLGAELISSDEIALYELIKNAFDAKSDEVQIDVVVRIPHNTYKGLRASLTEEKKNRHSSFNELRQKIIAAIDSSAPLGPKLKDKINEVNSSEDLVKVLDSANYISIKDSGEGMSSNDLEEIYLTIGTRSRYKQREQFRHQKISKEEIVEESIRPILGEKGVGRLSAMRLGQQLKVKTKRVGEKQWNYLEIDWSQFSHESDQFLDKVDAIDLRSGERGVGSSISGTTITISGLNSQWSPEKLQEMARNEFGKLIDPFSAQSHYSIKLTFNGDKIRIPSFDSLLPQIAHAYIEAKYTLRNGEPKLTGKVDYLLYKKTKNFEYGARDLRQICDMYSGDAELNLSVLKSMGPFKMMFYWFNRRLIKGIDGIGNQQYLRNLIYQWAGGLMVFRDGFRIYPYGGENDDWLDLDKRAFQLPGFKMNRRQVIGKVDISSYNNPMFKDQTNRQGLQHNDEFEALRTILKTIFYHEFKVFTEVVEKELKAVERASFKILEERVDEQEKEIIDNLERLIKEYNIPRKANVIRSIEDAIEDIKDLLNKAKELADVHEDDKSKYLHLAALGLMAEILAHELNRTSANVISTLRGIDTHKLPGHVESQLKTLSSQMKTLQKRLKILDPLSTRGRQVKEQFDLVAWVEENMNAHKAQFDRHDIHFAFIVKPRQDSELVVKAVKGMVVQILENLTDNSVYWLKDYKKSQDTKYRQLFRPKITVEIDTKAARLYFSDNGPGIPPARLEEVFLPFWSTKPFKAGKGLGLYISREIAEYNGAQLKLDKTKRNDLGNLNTFIFDLGGITI